MVAPLMGERNSAGRRLGVRTGTDVLRQAHQAGAVEQVVGGEAA
jgi:hypothetical protein